MPENYIQYQERLISLRREIKKYGLSGFILPRTDEFQGEFLADYAERLAWLTGFTGSAGSAVILSEKAAVLSDGRYTIQLKNQVPSDLYFTENIIETTIGDWLVEHANVGDRIGYDVWLYTPKQIEKIKEKIEEKLQGESIELVPMDINIVDDIWVDQPAKPTEQVTIFPDEIAGRSSEQKRSDIAKEMTEKCCSASLISLGDSICWLLNVRGGDLKYSPLVLSYAILYADGSLDWFVDSVKLSKDVLDALGEGIQIYSFDQIREKIKKIKGSVWYDRASSPMWFEQAFGCSGIDVVDLEGLCIFPKSIKSLSEQEAVRDAHIHDGVAIVKFLKWLDEEAHRGKLTELSVEEKLEGFRRENGKYLEASFPTIAGFAGNGAIVHYRACEETNKDIKGDGLLLVDSGGQYKWGTTDITRTISIGTPSTEMKVNYTRVLKGHIALARARFPRGTVGKEIDALARKFLNDAGLDYAHGTGHGVGCYLCVHETAANISPRGDVAFEPGMLISNEPGYYKEDEYGIRIENLILVQSCSDQEMLRFETVTLAPFDIRLIEREMMNDQEIEWLRQYSKDVYKKLSSHLSKEEGNWLKVALSDFL